jgi:hypothetical protein
VPRLYLVGVLAERFGKLPNEVIRDLESDPEMTAMICLDLLNYSKAKSDFDACKGDDRQLEQWKGNATMKRVEANHFFLFRERRKARAAAEAAAEAERERR